jgi:hypothetical protein
MQNSTIDKHFSIFNQNQIEAIKLIIKGQMWGDSEQLFADGNEYDSIGYFTSLNKGLEWSGTLSGISKKIQATQTNLVKMHPGFWSDSKIDLMFFNNEIIRYQDLEVWANQ